MKNKYVKPLIEIEEIVSNSTNCLDLSNDPARYDNVDNKSFLDLFTTN